MTHMIALAVGFPLGLYSGYHGGRIDKVIVLVMDSIYSFPGLLFAGLIAVLLGKGVINFRRLFEMIERIDDKHLYVEQETYPGAPIDSVRRDYEYISRLEF